MYNMNDLRVKNRQELLNLISELKGKLLALRFETATGQLTETHLIRNTKQDIARIFTVLKEQEQGIVIKLKEEPSKKAKFAKKSDSSTKEEKIEITSEDTKTIEEEKKPVKDILILDDNAAEVPLSKELKNETKKETESIKNIDSFKKAEGDS